MKKKLSDLIYEKDFTRAQFGWKAEEVDEFLDKINVSVIELENELSSLKREYSILNNKNLALTERNNKLELENTKLKGAKSTSEVINTDNYNNVKLLERISRLEDSVQELVQIIKYKNL